MIRNKFTIQIGMASAIALMLYVGPANQAQAGAYLAMATSCGEGIDNTKIAEVDNSSTLLGGTANSTSFNTQWHTKISNNLGNYFDCGTPIVETEYKINMNKDPIGMTQTGIAYGQNINDPVADIKFTSDKDMQSSDGRGEVKAVDNNWLSVLKFEVTGGTGDFANQRFGDFAASIDVAQASGVDNRYFGVIAVGADSSGQELISVALKETTNAEGTEDFYLIAREGGWFNSVYILSFSSDNIDYVGPGNGNCGIGDLNNFQCDGDVNLLPNIKAAKLFEVSAAVPIPAAAWLFGSALIGLAGIGRRRNLR